jgi:GDP/UDP-N,N'-diacetylbacillosamine 2-epimerase (hydrolysing)
MKRKICVITSTRADYGLLRCVMEKITLTSSLELQVVVTGMHLSPEFGLTYQEIEQDNFKIAYKIEALLSSDTAIGVAKSIGLSLIGFADALNSLQPDLVIILGDRFEIFAAATACHIAGIPIAHLHGGEVTEGAFDDALRHAITKMSSIHFVATDEYMNRVIQLGEQPTSVFLVGGLGVDSILHLKLLTRNELEQELGIKLYKKNLLITFHPTTLEKESAETQFVELLAALDSLQETRLVFTYPNADTGGRVIIKLINDFIRLHPNASAYPSLGQQKYFSCVNEFDGVIGNSSSGIIEVPSFQKGTINIGSRQKGRLQAKSILNCEANRDEIKNALSQLYTNEFQENLINTVNPYGDGGAADRIVSIIEKIPLDGINKKHFYDISSVKGRA